MGVVDNQSNLKALKALDLEEGSEKTDELGVLEPYWPTALRKIDLNLDAPNVVAWKTFRAEDVPVEVILELCNIYYSHDSSAVQGFHCF
jgi:hypothetical protein